MPGVLAAPREVMLGWLPAPGPPVVSPLLATEPATGGVLALLRVLECRTIDVVEDATTPADVGWPFTRALVALLPGVVPPVPGDVPVECRTIDVVEDVTTPAAGVALDTGNPPNGFPGASAPWWVLAEAAPAADKAIHSIAPEMAEESTAVRTGDRAC
jgi:hypothetical protein